MPPPKELSFQEILNFMLAHDGKVTNHELVKHFKVFLTDPDKKNEYRNTFKQHVNSLAVIKNQDNEKWIILKKKYLPICTDNILNNNSITMSMSNIAVENDGVDNSISFMQSPEPIAKPLNEDFNIITSIIQETKHNNEPIPVKMPTEINPDKSIETTPKLPFRKKSTEQSEFNLSIESNKENRFSLHNETPKIPLVTSKSESELSENEKTISVKERKQMFNRMASEGDVKLPVLQNLDEGDRVSIGPKHETEPLDPKQKQWILAAAKGEYHVLAKMCKENPKIAKTKDPFTGYTAMHWACKKGDENLVKLLAGFIRKSVNEKSNGGHTPLHLAMQGRHENIYRLLVDVYDGDPNIRDWSGRKPRQCLVQMNTTLSPESYRKKESFLRIGSLNVRVKKTTEAFSHFLGVGCRASSYVPKSRRESRNVDEHLMHKSWGSADNIQENEKSMLPPMSSKVKRRNMSGRKTISMHSRSTPSTPDQSRASVSSACNPDSDSDSAAGFHADWRKRSVCE